MAPWQNFGNLTAGNEPASLFDTLAAQIAQCVIIPCVVSGGANNLTLTPAANAPAVPSYTQFTAFAFVPTTNSTGPVQVQVAGLGAIPLFLPGNIAAGSGSLLAGSLYIAAFQTSLAANGGLIIISATPASIASLPVLVSQGGTGTSSFTPFAPIFGGTTGTGALQSAAGLGTAGQVLTSNGPGQLATFQGGSGQVLLNTLTASGSATLSDTTHITATYASYMFIINDIIPANNGVNFQAQLSTNAGSTWLNTNYQGGYFGGPLTTAAATTSNDTLTTGFLLSGIGTNVQTIASTAALGLAGVARLFNPGGTTASKKFLVDTAYDGGGAGGAIVGFGGGYQTGTSAINGIQFFMSAGNITSGTIEVWGLS